jgi:hypothetical protein
VQLEAESLHPSLRGCPQFSYLKQLSSVDTLIHTLTDFQATSVSYFSALEHYSFAVRFSVRRSMFLIFARILVAMGVVIAHYFSGAFGVGTWIAGLTLFVFAWIGRGSPSSFRSL